MGRPRKSAQDWIFAALLALSQGGIEAVRVERLARAMGVTKGSFYWHFADRGALLAAILAWWEEAATLQIIEQVNASETGAAARLRGLAYMTLRGTEAYDHVESGLRRWAAIDDAAGAVVRRVDATRLGYVEGLLTELGRPPAVAQVRAGLLYRVMIGEYTWRSHGGEALDDAGIEALVDWVVSI